MHGPEMLILDEPLAGLDPPGIDAIGTVLRDEARKGTCVLFSSHQLDQVEDLCEEVVIIDHGHLVTAGSVDDLATSGSSRLVVRVEEDRAGDPQLVLRAAMQAGTVTEFVVERRRLSEVFREALA